jgi:hypothetical protein
VTRDGSEPGERAGAWPAQERNLGRGGDRTVTAAFRRLTPAARMDWLDEMADIRWRGLKRRASRRSTTV